MAKRGTRPTWQQRDFIKLESQGGAILLKGLLQLGFGCLQKLLQAGKAGTREAQRAAGDQWGGRGRWHTSLG
jgi:hypothetical protein